MINMIRKKKESLKKSFENILKTTLNELKMCF